MLTLFLGLMVSPDALAFYNPSTGRWLSRDPVGEAAFFNHVAKRKWELSDESLYYTAIPYAFVRNDSLNHTDYVGLLPASQATATVPDCTIVIYAGHGFLDSAFDDQGQLANPNAPDGLPYPHNFKGSQTCSGAALIACNAAKFASIENQIPGVSLSDSQTSVAQGYKELESAVGSAKEWAKEICKNCDCKEVKITIHCFPPMRKPGWFRSGSPWCGQTITVPCCK